MDNAVIMERDFKGVWIPKEIWLDTRLGALDKIIYTEIASLDCEDHGCYASNEYLADFCQCSERKITECISKLKDLAYIYVEAFDGRHRSLRINTDLKSDEQACIEKNVSLPRKKCYSDSQNLRGANINNIDNNIYNFLSKDNDKPLSISKKSETEDSATVLQSKKCLIQKPEPNIKQKLSKTFSEPKKSTEDTKETKKQQMTKNFVNDFMKYLVEQQKINDEKFLGVVKSWLTVVADKYGYKLTDEQKFLIYKQLVDYKSRHGDNLFYEYMEKCICYSYKSLDYAFNYLNSTNKHPYDDNGKYPDRQKDAIMNRMKDHGELRKERF